MKRSYSQKVVYQIYPKSFCDSNGDGIGDFPGIISKLDYLALLGIDCIWLNACFESPQRDNGYDVSDYYKIDPDFGTMADFEQLCQEAKARNIDIMLDMVFNHTSTEHDWFQKAIKGDKSYQDHYIFLPPNADGSPPTNWQSKFGGNAWEYVPELNLYYLHLFDVTQADLNWNQIAVRQEMANIVNFWQHKGVNGFRFDVVNLISKPSTFQDDDTGDGRRFYTDGPKVSEYLRELNLNSFGHNPEALTVGEMSSTTLEQCVQYANSSQDQLSMVFNFHHLKVDYANNNKWALAPLDFKLLKSILFEWQVGMQHANAWMALFWCNHDQPRVVSRFGNDESYRNQSAKMLATTLHLMRGTPYIYQGEEIGMGNAYFEDIKFYRDVESLNYFDILKNEGLAEEDILKVLSARSRDNARTPMAWDSSPLAGFSSSQSWIDIPKESVTINVQSNLKESDSIFFHYQTLIKLRKTYPVIAEGSITPLLYEDESVFAYQRDWSEGNEHQSLIVLNHFFDSELHLDLADILGKGDNISHWQVLINNYPDLLIDQSLNTITLRPYQSIALLKLSN